MNLKKELFREFFFDLFQGVVYPMGLFRGLYINIIAFSFYE